MGCIILEMIVWLLYGMDGLKLFYGKENSTDPSRGTLYHTVTTQRTAEVSRIVSNLMEEILGHDPECNQPTRTALGDLLKLVKNGLLVVNLPYDAGSRHPDQCRINATELCDELRRIKSISEANKNYLFTGDARCNIRTPRCLSKLEGTELPIHQSSPQ